ncbi:SDR family NAD(P)-dependent oxidoreductase [Acidithiobacillus sp. M4-SHS-6]|uniref:SDR family NAD(P)-dependent oxidoreductase n=1 Tax=Acidithiobacillus sp. M4-SHS-6 TaxID=3383024 RepID=UPI0039BE96A4
MIQQFIEVVNAQRIPVAIVVGASGGVGASCARMLSKRGRATLLLGRSESKLIKLADELRQSGDAPSMAYRLDLCNPAEIEKLAKKLELLETANVLIFAAGITSNKTLNVDFDELQQVLNTNLVSTMWCAKHLVPALQRSRNSYIINIASRAGVYGFADKGVYGASKAATMRYLDSLRAEIQSKDMRVTSICPGWINTPMATRGGCKLAMDEILQPEDISSMVEWLLFSPLRVVVRDVILESR